jgi:hypothetical protein
MLRGKAEGKQRERRGKEEGFDLATNLLVHTCRSSCTNESRISVFSASTSALLRINTWYISIHTDANALNKQLFSLHAIM